MARRPRDRGDAGAVLPVVAMAMALVVTVAAFAVDLGMQRVLRRDLQALADAVAMDLTRSLDGRTTQEYAAGDLDHARDRSVARNAGSVLGDQLTVDYVLGNVGPTGTFTPSAPAEVPHAVRVTASGRVDFAFRPGSGGAGRHAVGVAEPTACFSVGSYAARVRLGDSWILGPLLQVLGTDAALTLLDLQGLADARVELVHLVDTDLGAGGFEEALDAEIGLAGFYLALADALQQGSGATAQVALLERLAALDLGGLTVRLADLLRLDTGAASGLDASLNVLDLVTTAAFAANGAHVLGLTPTAVSLGSVTDLTAGVVVGQRPSIACGRVGHAHAESSQVTVALGGRVVALNLGVLSLRGTAQVEVAIAPAEGRLTGLRCTPAEKKLDIAATGGLLDLRVTLDLDAVLLPALFGGVPLADVPVVVTTSRSSPARSVPLQVIHENYGGVMSTGQGSLGVPNLHVDTSGLRAAGIPLGMITDSILAPLLSQLLNPLVQGLDQHLLDPLLTALGINVAGADYASVPRADCGRPALRG